MKRISLIALIIMFVGVSLWGQYNQTYLPLDGVDESKIAIDPITGQHLFLGLFEMGVGREYTLTMSSCTADTEDLTLRRMDTEELVAMDPETGKWKMLMSYATEGRRYLTFELSWHGVIRKGTIVFDVSVGGGAK